MFHDPVMFQPIEPLDHLRQRAQEHPPVFVVFEDRLAAIAARGHVVKGAVEFNAQGSGHIREHTPVWRMLQCEN